jgi:outer membrane protein insertion porin family
MKPLRLTALALLSAWLVAAQAVAQVPKVAEVVIKGNTHIATDTIQSVLRTKVGEDFSETVMKADLERIRRLGFFYEDSVGATDESVPEGKRVIFTVEEHPVVQKILFKGNTVISNVELAGALTTKVGQVMNSNDVAKDMAAIINLYQQKGYQAVIGTTDPEQIITREGELTFPIIEAVVEAIQITGNRKTKTNVIRRELRTKPGDVLNIKKLQRDLERIYNLDLFEDVSLPPDGFIPGSEPGKVIIRLNVKEKKTGQISLGVGYSSPQGVVGRIELSETNFRGLGEGVNLLLELGGRAGRTSYEVGFFEPYIDHHHTSLSFSVYNKVIYRFANSVIAGPVVASSENDLFNEIRKGGQLTLTRPLNDNDRIVLGLRTEDLRLNLSEADQSNPDLPDFVRQEGRISALSPRYIRDTRDILTDPAKGVYDTYSLDLGNSDIKPDVKGNYTKASVDLRRYFSHGVRKNPKEKKTVWAGRVILGTMTGKIPFSEQFFVGGAETLRGYLESRFWGKNMFLTNLEYRKPIANAFQGVLFVDLGDAWGTNYNLPTTVDPDNRFQQHNGFDLHVGTGAGVRITTPIGPLRLDYGIGSEGSRVHFSIGHVF